MGALIVADEMNELKVRLDKAEAEIARLSDIRAQAAQAALDPTPVTALDSAAGRLEALAARIVSSADVVRLLQTELPLVQLDPSVP
eukprot:gene35334-39972_t